MLVIKLEFSIHTGYFQQFLIGGLRENIPLILKTIFLILLVIIYVNLNIKPLKKCVYFWVPIIVCPNLTSLYIHYTTNGFVPVVRKMILHIMFPVRTSSILKYILVQPLVYFSILNPCFASLFQSSILSIFLTYILALRVYFSPVSCLFFDFTSSLCESILVESLVYFLSLHARFATLFQSSLLSIFQYYILAL